MGHKRKVYKFNSAIVRKPSQSVSNGLRALDTGNPTYEAVLAEHEAYIAALKAAGMNVQILEPLEAFPDSIFVEDPALVFSEGAILLKPGVDTRAGEVAAIAPALKERFDTILKLANGYVDGGDILNTPQGVMIGTSERTSQEGAEALVSSLEELGYQGLIFKTPANVLHFKSDCSLLDETTVLSTKRLAASGVFKDFNQLLTPDGEEAAANALRVNDTVLLSAGHPQTESMLKSEGYNIVTLKTSDIAKIDAGLSCMSLRWHQE